MKRVRCLPPEADRNKLSALFLTDVISASFAIAVDLGLNAAQSGALVTRALIGAVMGSIFVNGMLSGYGALISELCPTHARATTQNVLLNIGCAVGGFDPLVVGAVLAALSFKVALILLASIYLLDVVATLFLIPERKGAALS